MKRKIATAALFISSIAVCFAAVTGLTGKWAGALKTDDGSSFPLTYSFKADGDKLTGSVMTESVGEIPLFDGKIKGDSIFFKVTYNGDDIPNSGKLYADSIALNMTLTNGKYHVKLARVNN